LEAAGPLTGQARRYGAHNCRRSRPSKREGAPAWFRRCRHPTDRPSSCSPAALQDGSNPPPEDYSNLLEPLLAPVASRTPGPRPFLQGSTRLAGPAHLLLPGPAHQARGFGRAGRSDGECGCAAQRWSARPLACLICHIVCCRILLATYPQLLILSYHTTVLLASRVGVAALVCTRWRQLAQSPQLMHSVEVCLRGCPAVPLSAAGGGRSGRCDSGRPARPGPGR